MIRNWNGYKELEIFDHFIYDYNLPKYLVNKNEGAVITTEITNPAAIFSLDSSSGTSIAVPVNTSWGNSIPNIGDSKPKKKFSFNIKNILKKDKKKVKYISVFDFFKGIETNMKKIENIEEISKYYENALNKAKEFGQKALEEKIMDMISVVKCEILLSDEFKYVTEDQIIKLYEMTDTSKNLKLTWIKNFSRIIPDDVLKAKKDADAKLVFDNYVILHYDPENNGEIMTKKEIEKKKDPILFGVFNKSKKLYYIADWKDEYCDLTLDEMFEKIGGNVGEVNNESVKTFIDKIKA